MARQAGKNAEAEDRAELALVRRIAGQDREAISELYRVYHARLFKFVYQLTGSYTVSDELVNDIMLVVWRKATDFREESRVSTWIFGIAYRQAMRRVRRKQIFLSSGKVLAELARDDCGAAETEDWVRRGLNALPAAQQLTVVLVFYLGLSYAETAAVTDCPVNTVKTRMFHARRRLRELLGDPGASDAASDRKRHG